MLFRWTYLGELIFPLTQFGRIECPSLGEIRHVWFFTVYEFICSHVFSYYIWNSIVVSFSKYKISMAAHVAPPSRYKEVRCPQ